MKKLVLLLPLLLLGWSQPDQYRLISAPHGFIENCDLPMNGEWGFIECLATFTLQLFDFSDTKPGVDNLEAGLTINGTTVTPSFRYKGGDADGTTWTQWTYGSGLALQAGTAPSYNQGSPLLGTNDDSVKGNVGGYYLDSTTDAGSIGTDDFVIEMILKGTSTVVTAMSNYSGSGIGWEINIVSGKVFIVATDASGSLPTIRTNALENGVWYHIILFINRDENSVNGARFYVNGVTNNNHTNNASTRQGSYDNGELSILARNKGSLDFDSNIAYAAMWHSPSWLAGGAPGEAEFASIAQERFLKLTGFYPQIAKGTATPTVNTRAYTAYLDKIESGVRKLYDVGTEWLRVVHRQDSAADDIYGYLAESQATNLILSSQDFSNTDYWTLVDAGDSINAAANATPDKSTTGNSVDADTTDGEHGVSQVVTLAASTYSLSMFGKEEESAWFYIDGGSGNTGYIDAHNCAAGTVAGSGDLYVEDWGGGWCRATLVYTTSAGDHTLRLLLADADGDKDVQGAGNYPWAYMWGAQIEAGDYMSSYIPTTTASATRLADQLRFKGDDGNLGGVGSELKGTLAMDILTPIPNNTFILTLSDGGSAADMINIALASIDRLDGNIRSSGGANGDIDTNDAVTNSIIHAYRLTWETDDANSYLDGVAQKQDTDVGIPDNLDRIDVGQYLTGGIQFDNVISNLRIKKKPVAP